MYSIVPSTKWQFYVFLSSLDSFHFFFFFLFCYTGTSSTVLNKNDQSGHPCLVSDLRGNSFRFSLFHMMLALGLSYMVFIMLRYVPFILSLLKVFIKMDVEFCWKLFLHLLRWSYDFYFQFVNVVYHVQVLNYPCFPGINSTSSWYIILLLYCWV